jgi:hypothetical protein
MKKDVDKHIKRMNLVRKYPPAEVVSKEIMGAMAGGVVDPDVQRYAYENGFFVLELTSETVDLIPPRPTALFPKSGDMSATPCPTAKMTKKNGVNPQRNRLKVPGATKTTPFVDKRLAQRLNASRKKPRRKGSVSL